MLSIHKLSGWCHVRFGEQQDPTDKEFFKRTQEMSNLAKLLKPTREIMLRILYWGIDKQFYSIIVE